MARVFQPARIPGAGVAAPAARSGAWKTGQTFAKGAVLILDNANAGELTEAATHPTSIIAGIALEPVASRPGYQAANNPTVVTGRVQETTYASANRQTVFSGDGEDGGGLVDPLQSHVGLKYGVAPSAIDGRWVIDIADTVNVAVEIVDFEPTGMNRQGYFFFKFLESTLKMP